MRAIWYLLACESLGHHLILQNSKCIVFCVQKFNDCLNAGANINGIDAVRHSYVVLENFPHYLWSCTAIGLGPAVKQSSFCCWKWRSVCRTCDLTARISANLDYDLCCSIHVFDWLTLPPGREYASDFCGIPRTLQSCNGTSNSRCQCEPSQPSEMWAGRILVYACLICRYVLKLLSSSWYWHLHKFQNAIISDSCDLGYLSTGYFSTTPLHLCATRP